jgi:hypothetical protein
MVLKLDTAYPKRMLTLFPSLQDVDLGETLVIANYEGPVTVEVEYIYGRSCIYTKPNKGYPGAPVFKGNRFVGLVKGNGENILPAACIDAFLLQ